MRIKFRGGVTLFIFCSIFIVLMTGCPMPEPEPTPPGTMDAPTLEPGDEQLIATWTSPTNNGGSEITGYELQYRQYSSDGGTTWSDPPIEVSAPAAKTIITGLINGTSYEVQVRARNIAGTGSWTDSALATPLAVPHAPDLPTLEPGDDQLIATWAAPTNTGGSAITGYELQYSSDGGTTWSDPPIEVAAPATKAIISGLSNGTSYEVQVRAINAQGAGGWSDSALASPAAVPHAPGLPSLTMENEQLRISWAAPTNTGGSDITGYELRYALNNSPLPEQPQISNIINTSTIMQLEIGSLYTVQVRAINAQGRGPWSESAVKTFPLVAKQVPEGTEVFVILSTAVDNAIANASNPNITVVPVTSPASTVVLPTIDAATGIITVTASTSPGTYTVSGTDGGSELFDPEKFFVTLSPQPITGTAGSLDTDCDGDVDTDDDSTKTDDGGKCALKTAVTNGISNWGQTADLNYILTTAVTDMSEMFSSARAFNGDISGWNVSAVTDMSTMFYDTDAFNGNISGWNVSAVTDMSRMFYEAIAFNQDLDSWTVSAVTDMSGMFNTATAFNHDLNSWTVSAVTDMSSMFYGASAFNGNISGWDVGSVTNMSYMFASTGAFNRDLNGWDVSKVTDMSKMFQDARVFTGNISSWTVSAVTDMSSMFYGASIFNGNISGWNVGSVTNMSWMFASTGAFNRNLNGWDVSKVTNMSTMFYDTDAFNGNISGWDVSLVTDMRSMFYGASAFTGNLETWKDHWTKVENKYTVKVTNMFLDSGLDANAVVGDDSGDQPNYPSWYKEIIAY